MKRFTGLVISASLTVALAFLLSTAIGSQSQRGECQQDCTRQYQRCRATSNTNLAPECSTAFEACKNRCENANTNASESTNSNVEVNTSGKTGPRVGKTLISGGILNSKVVSKPAPVYPARAKSAGVSGTVIVEIVFDETGRVISARAIAGPRPLRRAATVAARRASFAPLKLDGRPVKVKGVITYNFRLDGTGDAK